MPSMSLSHKIKLFSNYIWDFRVKEIYNIIFWIYPLWWNKRIAASLLNNILPKMGIDLFPPFLEIEPTTVCNFRCKTCEHTYWKEPSLNMDFKRFKHLFDQFGRLKWLGLTGIGSSYLNPDFHKMIAYAKSKGTIVEIMDHFSHFKDESQIRELLEIGPDFQFVSIYGGTKKTSDKVCLGSDYDKVIENVKIFSRLKKQMKKRFPILSFHYIVTKDSKEEIFGFLDFLKTLDTEVAEVLVTPMLHDFDDAKEYAVELDSDYIKKIRKKAKQVGISTTVNMIAYKEAEGLDSKPPFNDCKEYIMPFIFVTGDMSPCCGLNESNQRDLLKKNSPGNLFKQNLKDVWYSPQYKRIRSMIRQNKMPQECLLCPAYVDCNGNPKPEQQP